jgi:hypothetical protein
MTILKLFLVGVCLLCLDANQKGWQGLSPLHSTRADVERLLGYSKDPCRCVYETQDEFIYIDYATGRCKGTLLGWNVPTDTVLTIKVRPRADKKFSELGVDLEGYVRSYDDAMAAYYTNNVVGITYAVGESGLINSITYTPSVSDNSLRCRGWPLLSIGQALLNPQPFDEYSGLTWPDETGRLDNFAVHLLQQPTTKAYIIVYSGRRARVVEARANAKRAKNYLVKKRGINANRILTIDGGHREQSAVELYALPPGAPPPTPHPTIGSK